MCAERRGPREVTGRRRGGRNLELSAAHQGATLITTRARPWAAAPAENEGATAEHGTGDRSHAPAGAGQSGHGTGTWPCGRVIRTRWCGGAAVGPSEWGAMPGRGRRGLRGVCEALCLPLVVSLCNLLNYALRIRPFSYLSARRAEWWPPKRCVLLPRILHDRRVTIAFCGKRWREVKALERGLSWILHVDCESRMNASL